MNRNAKGQKMKHDATAPLALTELVKAAWIREEGHPMGQPAPGFFRCSCGRKVSCPVYGQPAPVTCPACGTTYNGHGWIIRRAPFALVS